MQDVHQELGQLGIDEHAARQFTRQAMNIWIDRGLLDIDWRMPANCAFSADLGRRRISVRAANWEPLQQLISLFCVPGDSGGEDDIVIDAMVLDDQVFFRGNDASIHWCEAGALAPTTKAHITERLVRSDGWVFALHAASLAKCGTGLLLCGQPAAGKSTLTLQLVKAGFQYAGDDVALIGADGTICGISFSRRGRGSCCRGYMAIGTT